MNNIKLSIDLLKLEGSAVVRMKRVDGTIGGFLAIPAEHLFIPSDGKATYIMCSMIPTPNSAYGDFMIKKFVGAEEYDQMNEVQRQLIPVIGKGKYFASQQGTNVVNAAPIIETID